MAAGSNLSPWIFIRWAIGGKSPVASQSRTQKSRRDEARWIGATGPRYVERSAVIG